MAATAISDEVSPLELVIVGTANDHAPYQLSNPTIALHAKQGTLPSDADLVQQTDGFCSVLERHGVKVLRPQNLELVLQTFVRDLGFVIDNTFVWCNPKMPNRRREQDGIRPIIDQLDGLKTVQPPPEIRIEGGDVALLRGRVLVGVGVDPARARTGIDAVEFLKKTFPNREIIPIALRGSDDKQDNPREHVLHLDCGFQPIGPDSGILFEEGFEGRPEAILDLVGDDHIIRVSGDEMFQLWPNLFSISPNNVVSAPSFTRLNEQIRNVGVSVLEVPYEEVAKLGGLFRCSTLPIRRTYAD
jgi:N-dimethylarginine dimethylaminohydrolase